MHIEEIHAEQPQAEQARAEQSQAAFDESQHMSGHPEFRMFKLDKRNLSKTPTVPGQATTQIVVSALYAAIHSPADNRMTHKILPAEAYSFYEFVRTEFITTQLTKDKMKHQNTVAAESIKTMATKEKIPQKLQLKFKPVTLGEGLLQTEEAARLNQALETIAADASKKNLEALQASRARLDQLLDSFDPRSEIQAIASKSYENICGGKGCNNLLDTRWHTTDFRDRDYLISDTLYSMAVYDGSTEIEKKRSEMQADANAKKLRKEEEDRKRSAADAIMENAPAAQDEATMLQKFRQMMQEENKSLRDELAAVKAQLKNSRGGHTVRGGHQQHTAPQGQGQSRGRGRGRGHQEAERSPRGPQGKRHGRDQSQDRGQGRGRGRDRSNSRPSSPHQGARGRSSRPISRSASPSGSTKGHQPSSSNQTTHRPWFAPPSRMIVQTSRSATPSTPRGLGGQNRPQQPHQQKRGRGNGRGRGLTARGQPRGKSRSRSNSNERAQSRQPSNRGSASPQGKGKGGGNLAQRGRGRGRGRGARGGHQSPRQNQQ